MSRNKKNPEFPILNNTFMGFLGIYPIRLVTCCEAVRLTPIQAVHISTPYEPNQYRYITNVKLFKEKP